MIAMMGSVEAIRILEWMKAQTSYTKRDLEKHLKASGYVDPFADQYATSTLTRIMDAVKRNGWASARGTTRTPNTIAIDHSIEWYQNMDMPPAMEHFQAISKRISEELGPVSIQEMKHGMKVYGESLRNKNKI